jgi:hypothetical protein
MSKLPKSCRPRENEPEGRSFEERPSGDPASLSARRCIPACAGMTCIGRRSGAGRDPSSFESRYSGGRIHLDAPREP